MMSSHRVIGSNSHIGVLPVWSSGKKVLEKLESGE